MSMAIPRVGKMLPVILVIILMCGTVCVLMSLHQSDPSVEPGKEDVPASLSDVLDNFTAAVDERVSLLRSDMLSAAITVSGLSPEGPEVAEELRSLYQKYPYIIDIIYVDSSGTVRAVSPDVKNSYIGDDISKWTQFSNITSLSATSYLQLKSQDARAICIGYPVYADDGSYKGYISASVDTISFFGPIVFDLQQTADVKPWVIDTKNYTLYNTNHDLIGKIIRPDLMKDSTLSEVFTSILGNESGMRVYTYADTHGSVLLLNRTTMWVSYPMGPMDWKLGVTSGSSVSNSVSKSDLSADIPLASFVSNALVYAYQSGDAVSLAEFNDPYGRYSHGERYIYAYGMDGTVLSLPYQQIVVGQNRYDLRDEYGVQYVRAASDVAQRGGGYFYYLYPNPTENFTKQLKMGYVLRVNEDWFIGSGNYVSDQKVVIDPSIPAELSSGVRAVQAEVRAAGKDAVIERLRSLNDNTSRRYVYAGDMQGNVLAFSFDPSLVGQNRLGVTDVNGVSYVRDMITLAHHGGGSMYVMLENQETGETDLHLVYLEPIDDTWFITMGTVIST